eukprot:5149687-Pyramimonas_sp.AAC.2
MVGERPTTQWAMAASTNGAFVLALSRDTLDSIGVRDRGPIGVESEESTWRAPRSALKTVLEGSSDGLRAQPFQRLAHSKHSPRVPDKNIFGESSLVKKGKGFANRGGPTGGAGLTRVDQVWCGAGLQRCACSRGGGRDVGTSAGSALS